MNFNKLIFFYIILIHPYINLAYVHYWSSKKLVY